MIFLKFILVGLFFGCGGEVVNQIYIKQSVTGFKSTVLSYFIFLILLFLIRKIFKRFVKNIFLNSLIWYIFWGTFGILIEWIFLGTSNVVWYGQIGMFTFWATMAFIPVVFTEGLVSKKLLKRIILYSLIWTTIFLVGGKIVNSGFGLVVWLFGCIWLNVYVYLYLKELNTSNPG